MQYRLLDVKKKQASRNKFDSQLPYFIFVSNDLF